MLAFIFDWILLILSGVLLLPAFYCVGNRNYGKSTFWMMISVVLLSWFFWSDILAAITTYGYFRSLIYGVILYVGMALVTICLFWISYTRRAGEKYQELTADLSDCRIKTDNPVLRNLYAKWDIVRNRDNLRIIFDDEESRELNYNMTNLSNKLLEQVQTNPTEENTQQLIEEIEASIKSIIPPRFNTCKPFIFGAGYSWPITLIWLLFSRVINQLIESIISMFGGTFNKISAFTFGKI
jgi:hypothetical protein